MNKDELATCQVPRMWLPIKENKDLFKFSRCIAAFAPNEDSLQIYFKISAENKHGKDM